MTPHMIPSSDAILAFGPFRLVASKRELWKEEKLLKLRALPLAVLAYLVQHPGRVIPIEEIRTAIWGDTRVGRGAIRVCVREIRQALGDEAASPQYIETVGRQGYRFLGARPAGVTARAPSGAVPQEGTALARVAPLALFVGRHGSWRNCSSGLRRRSRGSGKWSWSAASPASAKRPSSEAFLQRLASGVHKSGARRPQAASLESSDPRPSTPAPRHSGVDRTRAVCRVLWARGGLSAPS